ncbi:MAG: ATP-grasp domain-containing protein, partial [Bacteroidetes bacterium]|nr:ATP-grasp domain-containing protein [Bacteroidota bacterium]
KLVDIKKEIAVIVARKQNGDTVSYPVTELVFHPQANLVEYLFSPADLSTELEEEAQKLALNIIRKLDMVGLLAVEMFLDSNDQILVNELAPRTHNSGHHTIEANQTSQFEQHLRAILDLPLGDTSTIIPSAMVNLLGEPGFNGPAIFEGMEKVLQIEGVHIHLYGKSTTKPFRKMGHVTITGNDMVSIKEKIISVKHSLKIKA